MAILSFVQTLPLRLSVPWRDSLSRKNGTNTSVKILSSRRCTMTSKVSEGLKQPLSADVLLTEPSIKPLSDEVILLVKQTAPAIKKETDVIFTLFYKTLFERFPSVKPMFNIDRQAGGALKDSGMPAQVAALAQTVVKFAENVDRLPKLLPKLRPIMHKHVARGVIAAQYKAVGVCLLHAMRETLGESVMTSEVEAAWKCAYQLLASEFIREEECLETELSGRAGFHGFADMRVVAVEKDKEVHETFLHLDRENGENPPVGKGQFVAVDVPLDGEDLHTMTSVPVQETDGHLSLVVPGSRERAASVLRGVESGDHLMVSIPCGDISL